MEPRAEDRAEGTARWSAAFWLLTAPLLLLWQGWLTLGLFGDDARWARLVDEQPLLSGVHPQHLYLGTLGGQAFHARGGCCVYDHAFQAGYPFTPIFNGCRLAQLFAFCAGGQFQPAAYKIGLAIVSLLIPLLLILAARGFGLSYPATTLATVLALLLWWGPHGRQALETGDYDVQLAALALLAHAGMLVRFHERPGVMVWLGLLATALAGWFLQPLLFPIALPLLLIYYLSVGVRHETMTWHVTLGAAQLAAVALNLFWLIDWVMFWWLRSPLPVSQGMLRHRTPATLWQAPLWGGDVERGLALAILLSAIVGLVMLNQTQRRPGARLLGIGALLFLVLAFLGISWEPLGQMGTAALLLPALWFACLPAAHAVSWLVGKLAAQGKRGWLALGVLAAALVGAALTAREACLVFLGRAVASQPLLIGVGERRQALLDQLKEHTTPEARILWEDRRQPRSAPHWQALLPQLTGRPFIGGLDSGATIEHTAIGLLDQTLDSRPIGSWSDAALEDYCRRYNVGWVVCWTSASIGRFTEWNKARQVAALTDDVPGVLFKIERGETSFTLKGKAKLVHADSQQLTLADLVPENGVVVLSLHYQAGMRASPSRVQVEREPCGQDPIGFVRLRVAGPVARVTLTWDGQ